MTSFGKNFEVFYQHFVEQIKVSKKAECSLGSEVYENIAFLFLSAEEFGFCQDQFPKMVEWELLNFLLEPSETEMVEKTREDHLEKLQDWFLPFGEDCYQYYRNLWLEQDDLFSLDQIRFSYLKELTGELYDRVSRRKRKSDSKLETLDFLLENSEHAPIIECLRFVLKMKEVIRKGWVLRDVQVKHLESDAEHTLQMLMMCSVYYHSQKPDLDLAKLYQMIIIHDLGETVIGDIPVVDQVGQQTKKEREQAAIKIILSRHRQGEKLICLWNEFDEKASKEAKTVYLLDKLDPILKAEFFDREENRSDLMPEFYFHEEKKGTFHETDMEEVGRVIKKKILRKQQYRQTPRIQTVQWQNGTS